MTDLIGANYTFVNEKLAKLYGIDGVEGEAFVKVKLPANRPGGVLGQASFLAITSNPTRTSPVKRGKYVLENLLGTPPPPPPPEVPDLDDAKRTELHGTLRQRMEQHRQDPICASCHARMDPIGFGLENFNAIGQWREQDAGAPLDSTGTLVSGEKFKGPVELREILLTKKRPDFLRCVTEKTLTYALGRGLEYYDRPAVEKAAHALDKGGAKFSALVMEVVQSVPFQMRRGEGDHRKFAEVLKTRCLESSRQRSAMHIPSRSLLLPRRTFLRGLGACLALPLLEAMKPAAQALTPLAGGGAPRRMVFCYLPNGMDMENWTPKSAGMLSDLPDILKPLAAHKQNFQVLSGLALVNARGLGDGAGDHARANACFLTGVHPRKTAGSDIHLGISVDQVAAQAIGKATRLPSLELSCDTSNRQAGACDSGYACAYQNNVSWRNENTPMPGINDPRLVFERLFGTEEDPDLAAGQALRESCRTSILDMVRDDARALQQRLGASDRRKVDEYLTALRETEVGIEQHAKFKASLPRPKIEKPEGIPGDFGQHVKLMYDLLAFALATDSTRIATLHGAARRQQQKLPVARRERRPPRAFASRRQRRKEGEDCEDQCVAHGAVRRLPREAEVDARRFRERAG